MAVEALLPNKGPVNILQFAAEILLKVEQLWK
jgi:hypothetical protein